LIADLVASRKCGGVGAAVEVEGDEVILDLQGLICAVGSKADGVNLLCQIGVGGQAEVSDVAGPGHDAALPVGGGVEVSAELIVPEPVYSLSDAGSGQQGAGAE
jgi:hypothetical protein